MSCQRAPDPVSRLPKKVRQASANDEIEEPIKVKAGRPKKATPVQSKKKSPSVLITRKVDGSATQSSSATSTRSAAAKAVDQDSLYHGLKPIVVFSSSGFEKLLNLKKQFDTLVTIEDTVTEKTGFVCVGKGGVKTTTKVLLAVALGKPILSDEWATQSAKAKALLAPTQFHVRDTVKEANWNLPSDWSSGIPRTNLFHGYNIFVTPKLKEFYGSGYKDIQNLLKILGMPKIKSAAAREYVDSPKMIILALPPGNEDLDAEVLGHKGYACY
ncbi:hypothetical protein EJ08DRAFT_707282 [Tothia fuscella]|uniref:BRCT domain-containing protein n=1 Tax=Tothia fuscella TaxID=1048955 RepID=A0A9P4TSJ1_9PEZI|nr:hypothetical protein EJ08DRAFT_707282 [Tothia fuscella]